MKDCYFEKCGRESERCIRIGSETTIKVCRPCASAFAKGVDQ